MIKKLGALSCLGSPVDLLEKEERYLKSSAHEETGQLKPAPSLVKKKRWSFALSSAKKVKNPQNLNPAEVEEAIVPGDLEESDDLNIEDSHLVRATSSTSPQQSYVRRSQNFSKELKSVKLGNINSPMMDDGESEKNLEHLEWEASIRKKPPPPPPPGKANTASMSAGIYAEKPGNKKGPIPKPRNKSNVTGSSEAASSSTNLEDKDCSSVVNKTNADLENAKDSASASSSLKPTPLPRHQGSKSSKISEIIGEMDELASEMNEIYTNQSGK